MPAGLERVSTATLPRYTCLMTSGIPSTVRPLVRVAAAALLAGTLAGCNAFDDGSEDEQPADETTTTAAAAPDPADDAPTPGGGGLEGVPELIRGAEPSVVAVLVSNNGQTGEGSGVVVREEGVIVTNNHVVAGADELRVAFADGTQVPATVEATDPFSDLAILRVDRSNLPVADLADGYPQIGQLAVALGNPLGFENTVTAGIISGIGRSLPATAAAGSQALVDLVQTDAAISPGNSGGPLLGPDGQVVGINVAYLPPSTGAVSLGFAIPSPTVSDVVEELLEDGTAEHAYLGVRLATVTDQIAQQFGLEVDSGAAIIAVEPSTPAAEAGLEPGDVILAIDGEEVDSLPSVLTQLRRYDPGETADLTISSQGEQREVTVEFDDRPSS